MSENKARYEYKTSFDLTYIQSFNLKIFMVENITIYIFILKKKKQISAHTCGYMTNFRRTKMNEY